MKFIVTAGGQGKKLWPYSTVALPKHFQAIFDGHTPYELTINALLKVYSPEDIFVSTKKRYIDIALQQAPKLSAHNLIVEPDIAKDRGPGEGYAFLILSMKHPDEPFMIVQADNLHEPAEAFLQMVAGAEKLVKRDKKFISGGMKATFPILGIDYIKLGDEIPNENGLEVYKGKEFLWRSNDYYKTKELIQNFHVITHSNHNCWYPDLMLDAYKKYRPDWYDSLMQIKEVIGTAGEEAKIADIYSKMEAGATEQVTQHLWTDSYIILLPYRWTDIGTWNSLYEYVAKENEVYTEGNVIALSSTNTLIKSSSAEKLIAVYGLDNIVIVDTENVLLVMPKDKTEKVTEIIDELKRKGMDRYL